MNSIMRFVAALVLFCCGFLFGTMVSKHHHALKEQAVAADCCPSGACCPDGKCCPPKEKSCCEQNSGCCAEKKPTAAPAPKFKCNCNYCHCSSERGGDCYCTESHCNDHDCACPRLRK